MAPGEVLLQVQNGDGDCSPSDYLESVVFFHLNNVTEQKEEDKERGGRQHTEKERSQCGFV